MNIRTISLLLCIWLVSGCAEAPLDQDQAKQKAEALIMATNDRNYEAVKEIYSDEFLLSEPMDIKKEKLDHLRNVLGEVKAFEFLSAEHIAEFGQPQRVVLSYRVHHAHVTTIEKFSVVEGEGGYRVSSHSVENEAFRN